MILEVDFQCNNNNLTPQMDPRGFNGTYEWIKIGNEKFVTEEIVYLTALLFGLSSPYSSESLSTFLARLNLFAPEVFFGFSSS